MKKENIKSLLAEKIKNLSSEEQHELIGCLTMKFDKGMSHQEIESYSEVANSDLYKSFSKELAVLDKSSISEVINSIINTAVLPKNEKLRKNDLKDVMSLDPSELSKFAEENPGYLSGE